MARERPFAAAATAAGAAAAGLFLWSKRTQISDQLSDLSEQVRRSGPRACAPTAMADDHESAAGRAHGVGHRALDEPAQGRVGRSRGD